VNARWGCLILGFLITALMILILISVRISGMPLSQSIAGGEVTLVDGDG